MSGFLGSGKRGRCWAGYLVGDVPVTGVDYCLGDPNFDSFLFGCYGVTFAYFFAARSELAFYNDSVYYSPIRTSLVPSKGSMITGASFF